MKNLKETVTLAVFEAQQGYISKDEAVKTIINCFELQEQQVPPIGAFLMDMNKIPVKCINDFVGIFGISCPANDGKITVLKN